MNTIEFNKIVDERKAKITEVLQSKAAEYAVDDERLYNFIRAGEMLRRPPSTALLGMAMKHFVSVIDMVEAYEKGNPPTEYLINEKIGDSINYLILLEAIFKNKRNDT